MKIFSTQFRLLIAMIFWMVPLTVQAQTPCATVPPQGVLILTSFSRIYVEIPDFNNTDLDGTFTASFYEWAYFTPGVNPNSTGVTPLQGPSSMPRSDFRLVSGTTTCFEVTPVTPVPMGVPLTVSFRGRHTAANGIPASTGIYSALSNPFGLPGAAPQAPTTVRVLPQ